MEEWYSAVRRLKDESENGYRTEEFCHRIFQDLKRMKLSSKEKGKFIQRMGPQFTQWTSSLEADYAESLVTAILNDDTFWDLTLKATIS